MKKIEIFGSVMTAIWIVCFAFLVVIKWDNAAKMNLNEWGDFLAGITAPVAFLWLIIGYFLQRVELKENTAALVEQREEMTKQAQELANQTKHLYESVRIAEQQAIIARHKY
ncbi:hypothetical protein [Vibrio vulnificus]|uniref:hypothetical protein n=1 Tax=Vibrio vulnificus TaxID=672 RepID=UPI000D3EB833|nr:hypothetical protein [Vibrio vulnificus]MBN8115019.1 hypothetical protein [Vibrio vulnificus]PUZ92519.1 hypothetical protein DC365_23210 [Vibrio vulnificus]HAS6031870.1 hypothetical protein [Vibrio vulnificus]HAS6050580.1 hypothetical protein [Vibrio vulnificus]HAS6102390.1 hypothetical protein [Vibrio vulnificus]